MTKNFATFVIMIGLGGAILWAISGILVVDDFPTSEVTQVQAEDNGQITYSQDRRAVSYQAQPGVSVLETLKSLTDIDVASSSFGEYVIGIGGVSSTSEKFWLYYINDAPATVGAADYIGQEGDLIEWRLE